MNESLARRADDSPRLRREARGLRASWLALVVAGAVAAATAAAAQNRWPESVSDVPADSTGGATGKPAAGRAGKAGDGRSDAQAAAEQAVRKALEKKARETELEAIEQRLKTNAEARAKLAEEVAAIRADRAKLNAALIDAAARTQANEERLSALEDRLAILGDSSAAIRKSFESRQAVIVEVLAALQRMGRRPPPAVLASPEDMLSAVRSSILLGAVVPELRSEAETLAGDLAELVRLGDAIKADREARQHELESLVAERQRLASLVEARQSRLGEVEKSIDAEAAGAAALAKQAQSLKELIQRLEAEVGAAQRNVEAARKAEEELRDARDKLTALAFKDPARLAPKIAFSDARGLLPLPVGGTVAKPFGAPDGFGNRTQGMTLSARAGAIVSAPCDGWVSYAGPFRSFGQLLIINAGGGYYVLLAGMERINVQLGQFVLTGEPVAVMGEAAAPSSAALGGETTGPALYIEFRKDGGPIDPSPWWAKSQGEKVRG